MNTVCHAKWIISNRHAPVFLYAISFRSKEKDGQEERKKKAANSNRRQCQCSRKTRVFPSRQESSHNTWSYFWTVRNTLSSEKQKCIQNVGFLPNNHLSGEIQTTSSTYICMHAVDAYCVTEMCDFTHPQKDDWFLYIQSIIDTWPHDMWIRMNGWNGSN